MCLIMIANLGWILDFECTYIIRSTTFVLHLHICIFIYTFYTRITADARENKLEK